jgi:integrase
LKQSTVVGVRSAIHGFLIWARANGAPVDPDRLPKVGAPKEDEISRRYLSDREVERLFECVRAAYRRRRSLERARDMLLLALLFGAGLRIGEVAGIRIGELSITDREVYLPVTKGSRPRYAELSGSVVAYARLYLRYRLKPETKSTESLFLSNRHKAYKPHRLADRVKELGACAGVDDLTSRCGRRHCITQIAGVNLLAAQKQAGHKYLATTQVYIRDDRTMLRAVVRANDPLKRR